MFDLLIKGGEVVDPGAVYRGRLDVAVRRNRIAAVEANIPAESAFRVIDASGQYVTPGLIDIHTHVYHGATYWGIKPDPIAARSGVTTWLDAGSAGAYSLPGFREYAVRPSQARIYALLNISGIGLIAPTWEHHNLNYLDVDLCCKLIDLNRDFVLGVKVRIDKNTVGANGIEPLRRARQAADRCQMPLMLHISAGPPLIEDVLELLRPGDILTHCFTGHSMRLIDSTGKLIELARRAWNSGVIMDVGHGAGSFSVESARALMDAGFRPDVISSDTHQISMHGPMFDLPTCLSKLMALGMSFEQVIQAATMRPAEVLGMYGEVGTLKPGALADIALFTITPGQFNFYDVHMNPFEGRELITNTLTIVNGRPMIQRPDEPSAPWIEPSDGQKHIHAASHTPQAMRTRAEHDAAT